MQSICEAGDVGRPAVMQDNTLQATAYMEMASKVAQQVSIQNAKVPIAQVADVKW
ncbi:MAG: ATP-binding protein involved in chromosome partitioning [Arcticibacterium sp.]